MFSSKLNLSARHFGTISFGVLCGTAGIVFEKWKSIPVLNAASPFTSVSETSSKLLPTKSDRSMQIMRFGYPSFDSLRTFNDYVLSYDRRNRVPHWVFEHLTYDNLKEKTKVERSKCEFTPDDEVHKYFRAKNSDYKGSGYDRGHMAAAGNHWLSQQHCQETFTLSNIAPQVGAGFNRGVWNNLEQHIRHLTKKYKNVYVCTGPLYLPMKYPDGRRYVKYEVIGMNNVAVPTHFFKVIVAETESEEYDLGSYVMPNSEIEGSTKLKNFRVPVESVERAAGILLFERIPKSKFRSINRI